MLLYSIDCIQAILGVLVHQVFLCKSLHYRLTVISDWNSSSQNIIELIIVESGQYHDGSPLGNIRCYKLIYAGCLIDNISELEIGESSSNNSRFLYIYIRANILRKAMNQQFLHAIYGIFSSTCISKPLLFAKCSFNLKLCSAYK